MASAGSIEGPDGTERPAHSPVITKFEPPQQVCGQTAGLLRRAWHPQRGAWAGSAAGKSSGMVRSLVGSRESSPPRYHAIPAPTRSPGTSRAGSGWLQLSFLQSQLTQCSIRHFDLPSRRRLTHIRQKKEGTIESVCLRETLIHLCLRLADPNCSARESCSRPCRETSNAHFIGMAGGRFRNVSRKEKIPAFLTQQAEWRISSRQNLGLTNGVK